MSQTFRCGVAKDVYIVEANIPRNRQRQDIFRNRQRQDIPRNIEGRLF